MIFVLPIFKNTTNFFFFQQYKSEPPYLPHLVYPNLHAWVTWRRLLARRGREEFKIPMFKTNGKGRAALSNIYSFLGQFFLQLKNEIPWYVFPNIYAGGLNGAVFSKEQGARNKSEGGTIQYFFFFLDNFFLKWKKLIHCYTLPNMYAEGLHGGVF